MKLEKTDLLKEKERLEKENKKLKKQIKEAKEYIETTTFFGLRSGKTFMSKYLSDLLQILGSDKE